MFFAYVFIAIGLLIFLNTLGLLNGTFWGLLWAAFFLFIGFRIMMRKSVCPWCGWGSWQGKMHQKIHQKMGMDKECCECECDCGPEKESHNQN